MHSIIKSGWFNISRIYNYFLLYLMKVGSTIDLIETVIRGVSALSGQKISRKSTHAELISGSPSFLSRISFAKRWVCIYN